MADPDPLTQRSAISRRAVAIPASGIRRFFDMIADMEGSISLGVGEPDFTTPQRISEAAIAAIRAGHTH